MSERKRYFDDRIFYDIKNNRLWIARPDTKTNAEPWRWYFLSADICFRPYGVPTEFIEIDRQPEMSLFE